MGLIKKRQATHVQRVFITLLFIFVLVIQSVLAALYLHSPVNAATITSRSLTLGSAQISTVTSYTFNFVPATTAAIQGIQFQACETAAGTCTAPTGLSFTSATYTALTGTWTTATAFTVDNTGANQCTPAANVLCAKRTQVTSESGTSSRGITFSTITNPNGSWCTTQNCTFFVRMTTYNVNTYTLGGIVDSGTVASSTTQALTVTAQILETLTFCVGSTTIDDATTAAGTCTGISGSSLNLGQLSSSSYNESPVGIGNSGDAHNGIAEVATNASNGVTIDYDAVQATSGTNHLGTLRATGANCSLTPTVTDQCINAIGTTHATVTAGTEAFGMTIAGINCGDVSITYYSCSFASNTNNLKPNAQFNCAGSNTYPASDNGVHSGTTGCLFAWDDTGTPAPIANSSTVVGNEAMILKFVAAANLVTPAGIFTANADFVAVPQY